MDVCDQPPLEPRTEALLERGNLVRRTIAAQYDLFLRIVKRIKRVKELGLRAFLPGEELDVVDQQDVDRPVALPKIDHAIVAHRVDHLVHEPLGRDVGQLHVAIVLQHVLPDRVHQMGFAEPHATVDEQRVVRARRRLGDGPRRSVRKLIRRANDEAIEGVARVEASRAWAARWHRVVQRRAFVGGE